MAATHALPPAPPVQRPRVLVVGAAFASAAAVMVFIGLIGIYLAERADTFLEMLRDPAGFRLVQGDVTAAMTEYTDQMGASVLDRSFAPIASALPAGVEGLVLGYAHSPACMAYAVDAGGLATTPSFAAVASVAQAVGSDQ